MLPEAVWGWSPTDSYAPGEIDCPAGNVSLVRRARSLSDEEAEWVELRHRVTDENLVAFLDHANLTDFDAQDFIGSLNRSINIDVAFSGGGYRAMLNGAGQLAALDNRTDNAWEEGLGGLIESLTYITGLSGGNWLMGTVVYNNWTSIQDILANDEIWDLEHSIINPGGFNVFDTVSVWSDISDDIDLKRDAGFNISLTDPWGRALSHQFFPNYTDAGAGLTVSTLRDADVFSSHQMPFPIHVADGRTPGSQVISANSTVFEITPYELGSWDPSVYAFTDVRYLGTEVDNGFPVNDTCYGGFDNAGFIMGTSSTLFNQFILQLNTTGITGHLYSLIEEFLEYLSGEEDDIAPYHPNPFYQSEYALVDSIVESDTLFLVDGGEDNQNVPIYPLIQPEREVDIILAFDNSADTNESWPNGASVVATYERQFSSQGNRTTFPYVPDINSFINLNLTAKPTFFGCDSSNLTNLEGPVPPLVVYIANRPFSYWSNTSTFQLSYEEEEKRGIIANGFEVASRLNMTLDLDWRKCLGCAIIRRSEERAGIEQSDECLSCFDEYCWDGSLDTDANVPVNFTDDGTTNGNEDVCGSETNSTDCARFTNGALTLSSHGTLLTVLLALVVSYVSI